MVRRGACSGRVERWARASLTAVREEGSNRWGAQSAGATNWLHAWKRGTLRAQRVADGAAASTSAGLSSAPTRWPINARRVAEGAARGQPHQPMKVASLVLTSLNVWPANCRGAARVGRAIRRTLQPVFTWVCGSADDFEGANRQMTGLVAVLPSKSKK